jgi:hypothetical protein
MAPELMVLVDLISDINLMPIWGLAGVWCLGYMGSTAIEKKKNNKMLLTVK